MIKHLEKKIPAEKKWYVIYTKSRHEKIVAQKLNEIGIEAYCPTKIAINEWTDRKKKIEKPLFTSYIFVNLLESNQRDVFKVQGVLRYIYWCGKPAVAKTSDIDEIKRWLNEFDVENIVVENYSQNQKVVLKSGSFINRYAQVLSQNGKQLVLELEGLGIRLYVKTDNICLQKAI